MARDRQRARERKAQRKGLERENVHGSVDHASGEVDEFQAGLVSDADGEPTEVGERELEQAAVEGGRGDGGDGGDGGLATARAGGDAAPAGRRGIGRFPGFLRACWAELQRVQWPDRGQVGQGTAVTLGFVALAGAFLGLMDFGASEIVDIIL